MSDVMAFRTFGERFKAHLKVLSPIHEHYNITGHATINGKFQNSGQGVQNLVRTIKEALYVRVNNPSLNKNIGKYHLPHIWDEVLFNISITKLKLKGPSDDYSICHLLNTKDHNICHSGFQTTTQHDNIVLQ